MHSGKHTRRRSSTWLFGLLALSLVSTLTLGAGCKKYALLLKVSAEARVDTYDVTVATTGDRRNILLQEVGNPVDSEDPTRDISEEGSELRLALEFEKEGHYIIHLVGRSSGPPQVYTRVVHVDGITERSIHLVQLAGMDGDGDGFISKAACDQLQSDSIDCALADCEDASPLVHPLAVEICEDGIDNDCRDGDAVCVDADGDGFDELLDCDDNDPTIYPGAPEPPNACDGGPGGLCGDGIDQNCDGQDTICLVDEDCDGSPAVQDCDDTNPDIYPGQSEDCTNGIDDNCNGAIDEGCVNCDLDGDGYQREDALNGCPDADNPEGQATDCNDFDSAVHPDITALTDHNEGGEDSNHVIYAQQLCDGIDNDCDGDIDEGCWPQTCDADQDGFQNASCNPGTGQEDCDDTNPNIYPGAPDICGDGVLQNCNTDTECASDGDGDLYNADVDCDDSNPLVHPGATEICNGVDDDCDGFVDEGNPDHLGTKMVDVYCNDDNDGLCGDPFGPGRCVCTKVNSGNPLDEGNRVACDGEDLGAVASPRCLFAPFPDSVEWCDAVDHDCDGEIDDPTGTKLLEFGWACGVNTGECVAGTVVGCDFTQTNVGALNEHYLCSPTFVGAAPFERCNGRDDDCDGDTPTDEIDGDNDGYIACSNCAGENLAAGIIGCDDCAPSVHAVNPGHNDNCNMVDDDCDPSTPNGIDQCGGSTPDCCGSFNLCTDLQTDRFHCGGCINSACDPDRDNLCANGVCRCGTGPTCNVGQWCEGTGTAAYCECNPNSCPNGCCNNNNCLPIGSSQSVDDCGDNGVTCFSCINERECVNGACLCYGVANPGAENNCSDSRDNDCDGTTNCADTDCNGDSCGSNGETCSSGSCSCPFGTTESNCNDSVDNDCDGLQDCLDISECQGASCGSNGETCNASGTCSCPFGTTESNCNDSVDNDCDGLQDCQDISECQGASCGSNGETCNASGGCTCPTSGPESNCVDGVDNDCDGNTDCDDSNCNGVPCPPYNGFVCNSDDNTCECSGNGGISSDGTEMDCGDGFDNDCDGDSDCDDPDCGC